MSRLDRDGNFIIEIEKPQQCDNCGKLRELRPYGPPGKRMICFPCATATPEIEAQCRQNFVLITKHAGGSGDDKDGDNRDHILAALADLIGGAQ